MDFQEEEGASRMADRRTFEARGCARRLFAGCPPNRFLRFGALLLAPIAWFVCCSPPAFGNGDFDLLIIVSDADLPLDWQSTGGEIEEVPRGTSLGTIDLSELSTANPGTFATAELRIAIYSPSGFIPRYRIRARLDTHSPSGAGDVELDDFGMGVVDIVAVSPSVGRIWNYDPATVGKNVDDEPEFLGTLDDLNSGLGGRELYRTRQTFNGAWNYFTLVLAVGPQFYTPDPFYPVNLELTLQTY
ncbi:MAG: hypothetical protein H6682_10110 [Candidatus Eisenbacteria bacterium]|nr:hypothetical protein [Candidatus Eisenbacteria bacterium]